MKQKFKYLSLLACLSLTTAIWIGCGGGSAGPPGPSPSEQLINYGSQPRWSPDGQKLAFGADGTQMGIWVYDRSNGNFTQVTDADHPHLYDYNWSPFSDQLAFGGAGAIIDSTSGIYTVVLDGSDPVRWYPTGESPCWSPDGQSLVFADNDQSGSYGIRLLSLSDTSLTILTNSGIAPQYNSLGTTVAYREPGSTLAYELRVISIVGGVPVVIADTCLTFAWTADGIDLVYDYMSYQGGDAGYRICSVSSGGGIPFKIVMNAGQPSVSVNGRIAYHGVNGDLTAGIYIVNLDGSDNVIVSGSGSHPSITSDGMLIAYARVDGIWLVTI
ncbi:hypothetical protein CEE37_09725 [candidate division LCP-89 bacterium B3_LCP]|uniref:Dipeptidylpeptidase IV N-terminal domain-containing protein n=1 Tax=candidate division LCP-89 bacterium B3_LCP TaxID=2012998 RepID=A0A532UYH9_UNCL8|nr:MAG: hypothetical protein CEE37_09725 [candidate division LCP-89 bacterium B3_LCP]